TTRWSDSPFAMSANRTFLFTVMSAGGTAAVWATVRDALSFGTDDRSFLYVVSSGFPSGSAGRCATTSALQSAPTETIWSTITLPAEISVTRRFPDATRRGSETVPDFW